MPIFSSLSPKDKEKTKILSVPDEGVLLNDTYVHCGHSIGWCWFASTMIWTLALFRSSGMKLYLLGPLEIRQYRNISSDGPSNIFHTFNLWQKLWLLNNSYEKLRMSGIGVLWKEQNWYTANGIVKGPLPPAQISEYKLVLREKERCIR